jgi:hypothetical protein
LPNSFIAHVARPRDVTDACLLDFLYGFVAHRVVVMQRYIGAGLRKGDRHAGSQALPGTGDQCVLALEAEEIEDSHESSLCCEN